MELFWLVMKKFKARNSKDIAKSEQVEIRSDANQTRPENTGQHANNLCRFTNSHKLQVSWSTVRRPYLNENKSSKHEM